MAQRYVLLKRSNIDLYEDNTYPIEYYCNEYDYVIQYDDIMEEFYFIGENGKSYLVIVYYDVIIPDGVEKVPIPESKAIRPEKVLITSHTYIYDDIDLAKKVIMNNCNDIDLMDIQPKELCVLAIQQHPSTLRYIHYQTDEICKLAIDISYDALQYVRIQTPEICNYAVQKDSRAEYYVKDKSCLTLETLMTNTKSPLIYSRFHEPWWSQIFFYSRI